MILNNIQNSVKITEVLNKYLNFFQINNIFIQNISFIRKQIKSTYHLLFLK
jgi:hypothetical protein